MQKQTLENLIVDALEEARMLEMGHEDYDEEHMLFNAMRLSGAPFSFVEDVYSKQKLYFFEKNA